MSTSIGQRSPLGCSDHQCRRDAARRIASVMPGVLANQQTSIDALREYIERWRHYDARIQQRAALEAERTELRLRYAAPLARLAEIDRVLGGQP